MRKRIALAALAAALAGCSDPKVGSPASPLDTSTIAAFCDAMMSAYAQKGEACYHMTPGALAGELDASSCRAQQAFADAGRLSYDAAQASRCVAELQAASCDQLWFWDDPGAPSCASVFTGHTQPGSACAVTEECAGGRCTQWTNACSGTCVAWLAAGEACGADPWGCAPGLACDASQVPARCAAPIYASAGQPCGAFGCGVGLWCDAGTCRAKTSTGSCTGGAEACAAGSLCMAVGPVDALCVPLVGVGDACGTTALCGPGSHCATSGRCEADPGPGQPCAVSLWTDGCAASWCDAGTCRGYVAAGGACTDPAQCGLLSCEAGACVDDRGACVP